MYIKIINGDIHILERSSHYKDYQPLPGLMIPTREQN